MKNARPQKEASALDKRRKETTGALFASLLPVVPEVLGLVVLAAVVVDAHRGCVMARYAPRTPFKFSLHVPDHLADTMHLSAEEHGAYLGLLFSYWRSGPPKDDDRVLARIVGMSGDLWAEVRPLVEPYFEVLHDQRTHWRTDDELQSAYEAIERSSRVGKTAAKARWDKEKRRSASDDKCKADAVAMRSHCDSQFQQKDKEHAPGAGARGKAQAKAKAKAKAKVKQPLGDFEDDVCAVERDLCIGGEE